MSEWHVKSLQPSHEGDRMHSTTTQSYNRIVAYIMQSDVADTMNSNFHVQCLLLSLLFLFVSLLLIPSSRSLLLIPSLFICLLISSLFGCTLSCGCCCFLLLRIFLVLFLFISQFS